MKKVLIVAVCLALVLTLAFTLGVSGKPPSGKPDKPEKPPGKLEYVYELTFKKGLDVTGTVKHCGTQGRFISSSNIDIDRPTLTLSKTFKTLSEDYSGEHNGQYLDLSEHKDVITMQFFFPDPYTGEKVQLNVYGDGDELVGEWLAQSFSIKFVDDLAEILPTTGNRGPHWDGTVKITIHCQGE